MTQFITRAYNQISFNKERCTITKTSTEPRLVDEMNFYTGIPSHLEHWFPRLISKFMFYPPYKMELEYHPLDNLGKLLTDPSILDSKQTWSTVMESMAYVLKDFSHETVAMTSPEHTRALREQMFVDKTEIEYQSLKNKFATFTKLCSEPTLKINNIEYPNFEQFWPTLKAFIRTHYCDDSSTMTFMHGDMCFSNILYGAKGEHCALKFLDPRGAFGSMKGVYGDSDYDLAKLLHSVEGGYEFIIYDKFTVAQAGNAVNFEIAWTPSAVQAVKAFEEHILINLTREEFLKVRILQGLIFIGMCARHYDSEKRQLVMYSTGVQILNECMQTETFKKLNI